MSLSLFSIALTALTLAGIAEDAPHVGEFVLIGLMLVGGSVGLVLIYVNLKRKPPLEAEFASKAELKETKQELLRHIERVEQNSAETSRSLSDLKVSIASLKATAELNAKTISTIDIKLDRLAEKQMPQTL